MSLRIIRYYYEGQGFGEYAIFSSKSTRAATMKCLSDCELAVLNKKDYQNIIGNYEKKQFNEKIKFFKNFRIFQSLSKNKMARIILYLKERVYNRNHYIY